MYKCFDYNGRSDSLQTCKYVVLEYERDLSKLITALDYESCETEGLNTTKASEINFPTVVKWNSVNSCWDFVSPNDYPNWSTKEIAKPKGKSTNTNTQLYNLYIIFKSGVTLLTNTEPVTFEEIAEAIRVLQKPFVFGKQIAEFKIEVL